MSGDLISKQALLKEIKEKIIPDKYGTSNAVLDVMGAVLQVIGEQTYTYDVEEVIQKLEKEKTNFIGMGTLQSAYFDKGIDKAIEIVKSGGITIGQKGGRYETD